MVLNFFAATTRVARTVLANAERFHLGEVDGDMTSHKGDALRIP